MTKTIKCIAACVAMLFSSPAYSSNYTSRDVECMAKNIYFEARGEGLEGMLMVAEVTINRSENEKFPNTICGVVNERGQFGWVSANPRITNLEKYKEIHNLSERILSGKQVMRNTSALYFKRTGSRSSFHNSRPHVVTVGNHEFYR